MLHRHLALTLNRVHQTEPIVVIEGPRGSGKTTLLRQEYPGHTYISLAEPSLRLRAKADPEQFLARFRGPAIIDDLHRSPELLDHLATRPVHGTFLFASSRRLRLPLPTLQLHRPTRAERQRRLPLSLDILGRFAPSVKNPAEAPPEWEVPPGTLSSDVRELIAVHDMDRFELFLAAARQQSGQTLELQTLANECEISHRTAVRWLDVLETCFEVQLLPAAELTFGRRLVRRPKLHFLYSQQFESRVFSEIFRNACHAGDTPDLRYWRDSNGLEVPLILQSPTAPPMPIAIAEKLTPTEITRLKRWMQLAAVNQGACIAAKTSGLATSGKILRYDLAQL